MNICNTTFSDILFFRCLIDFSDNLKKIFNILKLLHFFLEDQIPIDEVQGQSNCMKIK